MCVFLNSCDVNLSMCIPTYNMWHFLVIEILFLFTWNVCWLKVKQKKRSFSPLFNGKSSSPKIYVYTTERRWKTALTFFSLFTHLLCLSSHVIDFVYNKWWWWLAYCELYVIIFIHLYTALQYVWRIFFQLYVFWLIFKAFLTTQYDTSMMTK